MSKMRNLFLGVLLLGVGTGAYFYTQRNKEQSISVQDGFIRDYTGSAEQVAIIKKQFKDNWYWLVTSSDYDIDHMLNTRSPNTYEPKYTGKMSIKVLYDKENVPVGFGTYYMRNAAQGDILFIAVDNAHRGKRNAQKLVDHAVKSLKSMGAKTVKLLTRIDNTPARKLYNRLKFDQTHETKTHVYFRKDF